MWDRWYNDSTHHVYFPGTVWLTSDTGWYTVQLDSEGPLCTGTAVHLLFFYLFFPIETLFVEEACFVTLGYRFQGYELQKSMTK